MENVYRQLEKMICEFHLKIKEEILKTGIEVEINEIEFKLKRSPAIIGVLNANNDGENIVAHCKKNEQGQIVCS